jgi:hypothetical protein
LLIEKTATARAALARPDRSVLGASCPVQDLNPLAAAI